jgi:hypothetical protein
VTISIFGGGGAGRVRYIITINGNIFIYGTRHVLLKLYQNIHVTISIFGGGSAGRVRYIITINGNIFMVPDMSCGNFTKMCLPQL